MIVLTSLKFSPILLFSLFVKLQVIQIKAKNTKITVKGIGAL